MNAAQAPQGPALVTGFQTKVQAPVRPARHPYRVSGARRLEEAEVERHIADLVRLVLLTGPGERLHRPDFGAGLGAATLFEPLDGALASVVEVRARGSLDQALGDRIEVVEVKVGRSGESTLLAAVTYRLRGPTAGRAWRWRSSADPWLLEPTCPPSARPEQLFDPPSGVHGLRAAQTQLGPPRTLDVWLYQDPPAALADPGRLEARPPPGGTPVAISAAVDRAEPDAARRADARRSARPARYRLLVEPPAAVPFDPLRTWLPVRLRPECADLGSCFPTEEPPPAPAASPVLRLPRPRLALAAPGAARVPAPPRPRRRPLDRRPDGRP